MRAPAIRLCLGAVLLGLMIAGCGSSAKEPTGLTIAGPGLQTGPPPWPPEYRHLAQRLHDLALPPTGKETFHIHAMLHIYVNGLLSPLPADIGIDHARGIESSLHTHDRSGVIHMESSRRFPYTLGDFFAVWGVKLGPAQVGGLKGYGGDHLHFYVNGRPVTNPAALPLRRYDNIVIGYGPENRFPHKPGTVLLSEVEKGEGSLGCGSVKGKKRAKGCFASQGSSRR
jgi:hypothetical protein